MQTYQSQSIPQSEWIKISAKGLVTLPKAMREQAGFKEGDVAKATLQGGKIIIEPRENSGADILDLEDFWQDSTNGPSFDEIGDWWNEHKKQLRKSG